MMPVIFAGELSIDNFSQIYNISLMHIHVTYKIFMKYILFFFFKSVYVYFKHILSTMSIRSYFFTVFTNYIYEPRARKKKT